jgi:polyhydroxyalkanoate synthesis regulator phasin
MQTQGDEFPYSSDDPSLTPAEPDEPSLGMTSQQLGDLKTTMRLVLGSTLTGKDVFKQRLRSIQASQKDAKAGIVLTDEDEEFRDKLRYLILGILFETPDAVQRSLLIVEKVSSKAFGVVSKILSPLTNSWLFSPLKDQVDIAAARGESVIDRLIAKGRLEEQNSRLMLQEQEIDALVNEVIEYVVTKTEIRKIIQEESANVAGDVVGEFQEQSAAVDTLLERKIKGIFRKQPSGQTETPPADHDVGRGLE